jgi:uncharacterized membrane protein SpoIIM required for sporulation
MRVIDRLAQREGTWRELDALVRRIENPLQKRSPTGAGRPEVIWIEDQGPPRVEPPRPSPPSTRAEDVVRLGELYRAACADLMLAEAHDLPRETVAYLHALVARAHNAVYRARGFRFRRWAGELFATVPRRLRGDLTLRLSALVFYGSFLIFALLGAGRPDFAEKVVGEAAVEMFEQMYRDEPGRASRSDAAAAGFYIQHNASIGLQCYAWGLSFGLVTLYLLFSNAMIIGVVFGYMARTPYSGHFFTFVTAHAPFELTAIVFSGAAGLRLGWGVIQSLAQGGLAPLRHEASRTLPTAGAAVFLFILAAFLEGFVSASTLPYAVKAAIAIVSAVLLTVYLLLGGRDRVVERLSQAPNAS